MVSTSASGVLVILRTSTAHLLSRVVGLTRISRDDRELGDRDAFLERRGHPHREVRQARRHRDARVLEVGQLVEHRLVGRSQTGDSVADATKEPLPLPWRWTVGLRKDLDSMRIEQDVHQPARTVETAPHPVVRPPGRLVEGAEVMELHARELVGGELVLGCECTAGVRTHLDDVEVLFHCSLGRQHRPHDHVELEQAADRHVDRDLGGVTLVRGFHVGIAEVSEVRRQGGRVLGHVRSRCS